MPVFNDTDRRLDADLGELDGPEPITDVVPVPTDWEPTASDDLEPDGDAAPQEFGVDGPWPTAHLISATPLMTAAEFAAMLNAQVGKPYVLGAEASVTDPNPPRFDCSELVEWAFGRSGNRITDLAAAQYNATRAVVGAPMVGDLVFLRNNPARSNGIGHVAVLTRKLKGGDWEIIEARGRASGVVRTTLGYWKTRRHFAGVRRLPSFKLAASTPVPTPKPSISVDVRIATLNCLSPNIRQGKPAILHPLTQGRIEGLTRATVGARAIFHCLTEAPAKTRYELRDGQPGGRERWLVWENGEVAIMFDSHAVIHSPESEVAKPDWGYWGAVVASFTLRDSGLPVVVGAFHLPPNSLYSTTRQREMLNEVLAEMRKRPGARFIGGDGMDDAAWAKGWTDARTHAKSSTTRNTPTYQNVIRDRLLSDSDAEMTVVWDGYSVKQATGTDHELVVGKGRISTASTL